MSPDGLNCSSKQSAWCWLSTIETPRKAYSHLKLTICCFKVQMFNTRAQYLLLHLPDTRKQNKSCEKNNIHWKAGQTAVQPVDSCFLPARFRSGFWVANLRLSIDSHPHQTDGAQPYIVPQVSNRYQMRYTHGSSFGMMGNISQYRRLQALLDVASGEQSVTSQFVEVTVQHIQIQIQNFVVQTAMQSTVLQQIILLKYFV